MFSLTGNDGYPNRWKTINAFVGGYEQIPHDTEIRHVVIPFIRRGFLFTLYHKSFDVVGDLGEIPEIEWSIEREIVETVEPDPMTINIPPSLVEQLKKEDAIWDEMTSFPHCLQGSADSNGEPKRIDEKADPVINFFK